MSAGCQLLNRTYPQYVCQVDIKIINLRVRNQGEVLQEAGQRPNVKEYDVVCSQTEPLSYLITNDQSRTLISTLETECILSIRMDLARGRILLHPSIPLQESAPSALELARLSEMARRLRWKA